MGQWGFYEITKWMSAADLKGILANFAAQVKHVSNSELIIWKYQVVALS